MRNEAARTQTRALWDASLALQLKLLWHSTGPKTWKIKSEILGASSVALTQFLCLCFGQSLGHATTPCLWCAVSLVPSFVGAGLAGGWFGAASR